MKVSLKANGLRAPGGLECPDGGTHDIKAGDLADAIEAGFGYPICQKCGEPVTLEKA